MEEVEWMGRFRMCLDLDLVDVIWEGSEKIYILE
jgi:hypothetical protein